MRVRQEFVLAFFIAVLAALLGYNAEQGRYVPLPDVPPPQNAAVVGESLAGATWLDVDDGTPEGQARTAQLRSIMMWIAIGTLGLYCVFLLAGYVFCKLLFPLKRRNPPPNFS